MYRIITSTTKEEHFESPNAAAYGMMTYCGGNTYPNTSSASSSVTSDLKVTPRVAGSLTSTADSTMYHGDYDVYGDLHIHGNIYVRNIEEFEYAKNPLVTELTQDPTSNTWPGVPGTVGFTANYVYICTSSDTWVRIKSDSTW